MIEGDYNSIGERTLNQQPSNAHTIVNILFLLICYLKCSFELVAGIRNDFHLHHFQNWLRERDRERENPKCLGTSASILIKIQLQLS